MPDPSCGKPAQPTLTCESALKGCNAKNGPVPTPVGGVVACVLSCYSAKFLDGWSVEPFLDGRLGRFFTKTGLSAYDPKADIPKEVAHAANDRSELDF